jgi:hypothetical protein
MLVSIRILAAAWLVALACGAVTAQTPSVPDLSLLRPSEDSYADATEFARFLDQRGISVKSIHRSKLQTFFRGVDKAALFKTDRGTLEVIFFPDSGAEKVSVTEHREGKRYIYSFRGQPQPAPPLDNIDAAYPVYFTMHGSWFIVTYDEKAYGAAKSLFDRRAEQLVGPERRERVSH